MNWSLFLGLFFPHVVLQSLDIKLHPGLEPSLSRPLTTSFSNSILQFLVTNSSLRCIGDFWHILSRRGFFTFLGCAGVAVVLFLLLPTLGLHFLIPNQGALIVLQDSV